MFLSPEIAVIDKLAEKKAVILLPCDMDPDVKERVKANIPKSMNVYLLEEPYFPDAFYPGNRMIELI